MDTKQIEYMLKIAEENNITHAAAKLFITQSALNQQLIKLENELGTPLFHRSRTNWRPTQAGEIYIESAREIMRIKQEAYQKIYDLTSGKKGKLSVGFTPGRGIAIFTATYKIFHQHFPNITIEPVEMSVHNLQKLISQGDLDIAFLTVSDSDFTDDEYETFFEEELVLAIPSCHPLCEIKKKKSSKKDGFHFPLMNLTEVRYEPFVLMNRSSTMRAIVDRLFQEEKISPQILFETRNNNTIISMIQSSLCCGILPYYYVKDHPESVSCFSIPSHPTWKFVACYRKDKYLSQAARYFIDAMKNNCTLT